MRRPPSLSESYLSDYKFIPDHQFFNEVLLREPVVNNAQGPAIEIPVYDYCEHFTEYLLRFLFHISMISFFETLFFFQFVSKDEDAGISSISRFYTGRVTSSCKSLNSTDAYYLNTILDKFVNSSQIINQGVRAGLDRDYQNSQLNRVSWIYFAGLNGLLFLLIGFSFYKRYKIRWSYLFFENLMFVTMLGIYEFMFFETIIKKYVTLTPAEISSQFVKGLQSECGLLL
jgi:hypothetical protein